MNYNQMPQMINGYNIPMMNPYQSKIDSYYQNQQQQNSQPFLTVSNMQEAKEKVINYNSSVWMRDSSEPYLYVKSLDMTGTPNFKVLKVEDVTDSIINGNTQSNNEQFVSIEQYNKLNNIVTQLQDNVNHYISLFEENNKKTYSQPKKVGDSNVK